MLEAPPLDYALELIETHQNFVRYSAATGTGFPPGLNGFYTFQARVHLLAAKEYERYSVVFEPPDSPCSAFFG